jgi:hypothetical protein
MKPYIRCLFVLVISGLSSGSAGAQAGGGLQATATLDRKEIQLGQSAVVIVQFSGNNGRPEITPPKSPDCSVTLAGRPLRPIATAGVGRKDGIGPAAQNLSESIRKLTDSLAKDPVLNPDALGKMTDADLKKQLQAALDGSGAKAPDENALAFHVHVQRTGTIVIPPFSVTGNGETILTKPLELHVSPARNQDYVRFALSLSEPKPVIGQEGRLYVDVLVRREEVQYQGRTYPHLPLGSVHISLPPLDEPGLEPVRALLELIKEHSPEQGHHGYKVNRLPREAVFAKEPPGAGSDPRWYRRRFEVPVRFTRTGSFSLPAAGIAGEVLAVGQSAGRKTASRKQSFTALSEPLSWEVRDLPGAKPPGFSGNIGELKVTSTASHTKMAVGTPFTLTVRLEGDGYLPRPGSVDLAKESEITRRFRALPDADRAISDKMREVTYTLRPLSPEVNEVPPVAVTYFDTRTNRFQIAKSAAIALEVADAANAAEKQPAEEVGSTDSEKQSSDLEDLSAAHARGWITRNLLPAAALALAFVVTAAMLLVGRWKAHRSAGVNRARLRHDGQRTQELRTELSRRAGSIQDVRELVQKVLRERFHLPPGEITGRDAAEKLREDGVDGALADECAAILDACAVAEFAPGIEAPSVADLKARAERWMGEISRLGATCASVG